MRRLLPILCLIALAAGASAENLISENFGGTSANLNGTAADTFSRGITSAGGSANWVADASFHQNGTIEQGLNKSAFLTLGSYINDTKGTAAGVFKLSGIIDRPARTGSYWNGICFFETPNTTTAFTASTSGRGAMIYRTNGELDGFGGTGSANRIDGPVGAGPQVLTIVLDLSDHNSLTHFGSVSFYQGAAVPANQIGTTHNFTADHSFNAVGITQGESAGLISGFQLEQSGVERGTGFQLTITPNATSLKHYDFEWPSQTSKLYDLLSDTNLAATPVDWEVWDPDGEGGAPPYGDLEPDEGDSTSLTNVLGGDEARRFFVVVEKDPSEPPPPSGPDHTIVTPNYQVSITDPGFRMGVSTATGIALPADPTTGLSFLGSTAVSSVKLNQAGDTSTFRVTNGNGQTALVTLVAKAHTIEFTVVIENGQSGNISMRTASPGAAYGLGDHGGWQSNANLASTQTTHALKHDGQAYRWLSSFLVFPRQGAAGACFERHDGEVSIGPSFYQMTRKSAASQKFYYFIGSMEEIYAAWRDTRVAEGYPGVVPKMDGFELGFETWDLLRWNTNTATCQNAIQEFLDRGYHIEWTVTGSGFWQPRGTTVSFGLYDFTKYPETSAPAPPDFGGWCAARKIRWMIGQRTNFVKLGGPHSSKPGESGATVFDTSPDSQAGINNDYFLKDGANNVVERTSSVFPTVPCYLLDGNVPGASAWFKNLYDGWGVDGVKEDTMMASPDHTIFNGPMRAIAEGGGLVMARCGAYSSPGTLTRVNDTSGASNMTLRCPINYLQYAASGAPNVYSDTVGFGGMSNVTSTMRHAWLLSLTAGMAVSDSPWNRNWSAANQAKLKKAIDFHYEIGPYLHSCAVDCHNTGYPHTMTPLPVAFPGDANTYNLASSAVRQFEWMIGPSLLAAPLLHNNYSSTNLMNIYLPEGKWIDIETGTVHTGPTTLADFDMPLDKTPVFVGGKGVYISRISDDVPLQAVVFPIANGGSSYTFTHPEGTAKSTITNNNTGWNTATLTVMNATTGSPVSFTPNATTGAIRFDILPGNDYALGAGN